MKNTRIRVVSSGYTKEQWEEVEKDLTLLKSTEFKEKWTFSKEGLRKYLNEYKQSINNYTSENGGQTTYISVKDKRDSKEKNHTDILSNKDTMNDTSVSAYKSTSENTSEITSRTLVKALVKPQVNYLIKPQADSQKKNRTYVLTDDFADMLGEQVKKLATMTGWSHKDCIEYIFRNGVKMTDELMKMQREENE